MEGFTAKPVLMLVLLGLLGVIVSIVILPHVDLPDAAFHRDTSPLALRAHSTSGLPLTVMSGFSRVFSAVQGGYGDRVRQPATQPMLHELLPILTVALRC